MFSDFHSFSRVDRVFQRRRGVYGPPAGKKMVLFVDDLWLWQHFRRDSSSLIRINIVVIGWLHVLLSCARNMPQKEYYGAQPPIELPDSQCSQWVRNENSESYCKATTVAWSWRLVQQAIFEMSWLILLNSYTCFISNSLHSSNESKLTFSRVMHRCYFCGRKELKKFDITDMVAAPSISISKMCEEDPIFTENSSQIASEMIHTLDVIKKPWTTLNDSTYHHGYMYIVTLLHYIIYSYHHHWIPRSWHLQWDHQEVAAPLSPNDWSVTTMPVPELATSVNFGLLSLEATRMDLVGFVNAALLMNFKYFKRSFLVSCLTQVLAYSDLQDNVAVFAHGMHVTNCDYSCHFSVWKSKAEGRSSCVRLLWQRENWGTNLFIFCHLSIGWVDTTDLPNNGWLLLCWAGLPRCEYTELDWELGTCNNHRPMSCFEVWRDNPIFHPDDVKSSDYRVFIQKHLASSGMNQLTEDSMYCGNLQASAEGTTITA